MKWKLLTLVLGLQAAWMLGTVFVQERARATGKIILLETRPVDPRDLLRGDYVILNYKISDVPWSLFSPPLTNELPLGSTVFVGLEPRGKFFEAVRASTSKLAASGSEVMLKGKSEYWWRGLSTNAVHVEYGLERYYVREGTGNPRGKITVEVAVPVSGRGLIKQVFVDGRPYAEAMKAEN